MAAAATLRLQTIVSREVSPLDSAVLTVGALQAGTKENIIPDDATIKLNVRTYDENVRKRVLEAIERICRAEATASRAEKPSEFTTLSSYPLTVNDAACSERIAKAFQLQFGERAFETPPASASEDFSVFGRRWGAPYVFWIVGGTDPKAYAEAERTKTVNELPSNHSPKFAPVLHPTLQTGLEAMLTAAARLAQRARIVSQLMSLAIPVQYGDSQGSKSIFTDRARELVRRRAWRISRSPGARRTSTACKPGARWWRTCRRVSCCSTKP